MIRPNLAYYKRNNMYKIVTFLLLVAFATCEEGNDGGRQDIDIEKVTSNKILMDGLDKATEMINRKDGRKAKFREVRHSIVKATRQVVSGEFYRVVVTMVQSQCKNVEENEGKLINECPASDPVSTRHCLVTMWLRSWKSGDEKLVVDVKCLRGNEEPNGRGERKIIDIKEVTSQKILMDGLDKATEMVNKEDDFRSEFREVRHSIDKAAKKVVSGTLYEVIVTMVQSQCKNVKENEGKLIDECPARDPISKRHCLVTMWLRPWKKDAEKLTVAVKCLHGNEESIGSGGRKIIDIEEVTSFKILMDGLDKATEMINKEDDFRSEYREVRQSIDKAAKTLVSGALYEVVVTMVQSQCKNVKENEGKLIDECPAREPISTRHCLVTMWLRPWKKDDEKLTVAIKCMPGNEESNKKGERKELDIKKITSNKILMDGLDKATEMINREDDRKSEFREVRHSIVKATYQLVAGKLYRVIVNMAQSQCKNTKENEGKLIDECPPKEPISTRHCLVTMHLVPWKKDDEKLTVKVKCLRGNDEEGL